VTAGDAEAVDAVDAGLHVLGGRSAGCPIAAGASPSDQQESRNSGKESVQPSSSMFPAQELIIEQ